MNRIKHRREAKRRLLMLKVALIVAIVLSILIMFYSVVEMAFLDLRKSVGSIIFAQALLTCSLATELRTIIKEVQERLFEEEDNVIFTGKGDTLFFDSASGRYFKSDKVPSFKSAFSWIPDDYDFSTHSKNDFVDFEKELGITHGHINIPFELEEKMPND